jgi:hypothetical protein
MGRRGGKYKRRKYLRALKKLEKIYSDKFTLEYCTNETYKIESPRLMRPYPVAANHREISEHIAKGVGKILEKLDVCTEEEFIDMIK